MELSQIQQIKELKKKDFIEKALEYGFTEKQAEFLFIKIEEESFVRNTFGSSFF